MNTADSIIEKFDLEYDLLEYKAFDDAEEWIYADRETGKPIYRVLEAEGEVYVEKITGEYSVEA